MTRWRNGLNAIAIAGVFASFFSTAVASELSENECSFVKIYEDVNGRGSFSDLIAHMAHDVEYCHSTGTCERGLRKRENPVKVTLDDGGSEKFNYLFDANLSYAVGVIGQLSGLDFYSHEGPEEVTGQIHVILVHDGIYKERVSAVPDLFEKFVVSKNLSCVVTNFDWPNAEVEYSEVWIKTTISPKEFANCVKEEVYNASGVSGDPVGLDSLFSEDFFSNEIIDPPIFQNFDGRALIAMKMVYSEEMLNGQSRSRTKEISRKIINASC